MIPFIKPHKPDVAFFNQLLSNSITQNHYSNFGPNERCLKQKFTELTGISNLVLTCNATVALEGLHAILSRRCGVAYLPSFTFPATNQGCLVSSIYGNTIDSSLDIGRTKWNYSVTTNSLDSYAITVNPFGSTNAVCDRPSGVSFWVVDNAAGFLSQAEDWLDMGADAVVYSLHATKILSACEGGVVFFKNTKLYEEYLEYINFGFKALPDGSRIVQHQGSNHKMSELSAAWCLMSLYHYHEEITIRRKIASAYDAFCKANAIPCIPSLQAFWMLGKHTSNSIQKFGIQNGVDFRPYYQKLPLDNSGCKVTQLFTSKGFCLPTRSTLEDEEVAHILKVLDKAKALDLV